MELGTYNTDPLAADSDNDGLSDYYENNDGNNLTGQFDHDNDGLADHLDDDDDNEHVESDYKHLEVVRCLRYKHNLAIRSVIIDQIYFVVIFKQYK